MKLPRFRLRTIFLLIALICIPLSWVTYQLNWVRQRHEFFRREGVSFSYPGVFVQSPAPGSLRVFGEPSQARVTTMTADMELARRLFPEAMILNRD